MKRLWVILLVFIGCSTSPNVSPQERKENAVMVMRDGEKINGTLNAYDYETGEFTFTSKDGKLYTNPELVKEVIDIWGTALLYESHIKTLNNKRSELGLSNKSGDQISEDEISSGQQKYKPYDYELESSSSPSDPTATQEVLKHLLDVYEENNRDVNAPNTPSILQTHLCQFDNSKLYTNGKTKYGQNTTKFRLWICPSDNSHQFWLPD